MSPRLDRAALAPDAVRVAAGLLGAMLVHQDGDARVVVRLTEVEAYAGVGDPGSHAYRGPTPRTRVMFGPAGFLYVYFTYGMHWCANVVCGPQGDASAVLLRAGEVIDGVELARARRPAARSDVELARGPARLAAALGLGRDHDGADLCAPGSRVWLEPVGGQLPPVHVGPRVGVSGPGGDVTTYPWRFWVAGDPTVSTYRQASSRPAGSAAASSGPATSGPRRTSGGGRLVAGRSTGPRERRAAP